ncbi:hypothetical protein LCGC14_0366880 [marine sediment metagenome]|uniref:Uncharacterized protein n=1 Tax=marine sediment metagenome TaxID=412755 RepID=A0A0F9TP30_9ZZZZ
MATAKKSSRITITPPNFQSVQLRLQGMSPLMQNKFSKKAVDAIAEKQTAADVVKGPRAPKDYEAEFNAARYVSRQGWDGVPCRQVRASMIRACANIDGLDMMRAKTAFFIDAHGFDKVDGTPLLKIEGAKPGVHVAVVHDTRPVAIVNTFDLRNRPLYPEWALTMTLNFDADLCTETDVANLLARAGATIGIGELRPLGKKGFGGDYGMWEVQAPKAPAKKKAARKRKAA